MTGGTLSFQGNIPQRGRTQKFLSKLFPGSVLGCSLCSIDKQLIFNAKRTNDIKHRGDSVPLDPSIFSTFSSLFQRNFLKELVLLKILYVKKSPFKDTSIKMVLPRIIFI